MPATTQNLQAPSSPGLLSTENGFGPLLRQWRRLRRLSQLSLACEADVSSRHLSFLETGKSKPSREMILRLSQVLDIPPRHSNTLLTAAGYTAAFAQTNLDDPELQPIKRSLELLLTTQNPMPSLVMDVHWNVHMQNEAAAKLVAALIEQEHLGTFLAQGPLNVVRLLFHQRGFRPWVKNWTEVAGAMVQRLHREVSARGVDPEGSQLLKELLAAPGVPKDWHQPLVGHELPVILPLHLHRGDFEARLFTTISTLGTAFDVTLRELVMETFLPMDERSEAALRAL